MYYTQKSRSSIAIDPAKCPLNALTHGRVAWLQVSEFESRVPVYWDSFEKKFVSLLRFQANAAVRAAVNRQKHALIPFGPRMRAERKREEGILLPPSLGGWAQP